MERRVLLNMALARASHEFVYQAQDRASLDFADISPC